MGKAQPTDASHRCLDKRIGDGNCVNGDDLLVNDGLFFIVWCLGDSVDIPSSLHSPHACSSHHGLGMKIPCILRDRGMKAGHDVEWAGEVEPHARKAGGVGSNAFRAGQILFQSCNRSPNTQAAEIELRLASRSRPKSCDAMWLARRVFAWVRTSQYVSIRPPVSIFGSWRRIRAP
jgi:hypothetical protein